MRSERFHGIVLRRTNVGEADRLIVFVTPEGKKKAIAKGVRKVTSRKAGALELFNVVDVLVAETKNLPIVREAVVLATFPALREDFIRAAHAYWAGELVDRLMEENAENSLYEPLKTYLSHLNAGHDPLDIHAFELVALRELGWQPQLKECVQCHATLTGERLAWSDNLGGVIGGECCAWPADSRPISQSAVKVLRLLAQQGYDVGKKITIPDSVIAEVAAILHVYLETLGERRWRSPALFTGIE